MIPLVIIVAIMPLSLADTSEATPYSRCDPVERLVEIQVCDYSNSPYGGICFYSLRQRPFRTDSTDMRSLPNVTETSLSREKERELLAFLGDRIAKVDHRPAFEYGTVPISQYVPPYQRFSVRQKIILCGPYAVPSPEVVPTFDVPRIDRWMVHPSSKKQFYISSEWVLRSEAELKCRRLGGRLAVLDEAEQFRFVAAIVVRRPRISVAEHGLWTAARNFKGRSAMYLQWAKGSPRFAITTSSFISDACVDTNFYLGRFASVSCNSTLRYVCEKDS